MKVLSISSDRKIFEKDSAVLSRLLDQASLVEKLVVVVFTLEKQYFHKFTKGNLVVLPTNSPFKISYITDVYLLAKDINGVDLISTQDPFFSGLAGLLLKWRLKTKLQVQIHTDIASPFFRASSLLNFIRFLVAWIVIPFANGVRVVSERVKGGISKTFGIFSKNLVIDVLPVYVDLKKSEEGVYVDLHKKYPMFDFIIFTSARIEKEKNLSLLLDVFKNSLFYIKGAGLVIAGDGGERKKLEKKTRELGIEKSVKFLGWQKNLIDFYESADLYVSTSNFEGYGVSLLEAGFYGMPIVSTDVGIIGEVYKDNEGALVCPVGDGECLTRKIVEIRKFVDVRERIAGGAKKSARSVIWAKENHKNRFLKLWKKTI